MFGAGKSLKSNITAIIVAGGCGSRMGSDIPKQFIEVLGKPVIAYTIQAFQKSKYINDIIIVTLNDYIVFCKDIVDAFSFNKVSNIVSGGTTRQESVLNGINELSQDTQYVMIHDAARPLIDTNTIDICAKEVTLCNACAVGVRAKDTIKRSDSKGNISETVDRSNLWFIQTPQVFSKELITYAHIKAKEDGFSATDDCALVERLGGQIKIIEGKYENIKITSPQDIFILEGLLKG